MGIGWFGHAFIDCEAGLQGSDMATKRAATCLDSKQKHKIVEQNRRHKKRAYFNELRTAADEDGMEADRKLTDTKILERSIRFMQKYENNDKVDEPSGSDTHGVYTHMCELIAKVYDESYDQTRYEVKKFRVLIVLWFTAVGRHN